jgi:hypothetical protein
MADFFPRRMNQHLVHAALIIPLAVALFPIGVAQAGSGNNNGNGNIGNYNGNGNSGSLNGNFNVGNDNGNNNSGDRNGNFNLGDNFGNTFNTDNNENGIRPDWPSHDMPTPSDWLSKIEPNMPLSPPRAPSHVDAPPNSGETLY